eukprot:1338555-Prymnesium_polylepis.1
MRGPPRSGVPALLARATLDVALRPRARESAEHTITNGPVVMVRLCLAAVCCSEIAFAAAHATTAKKVKEE